MYTCMDIYMNVHACERLFVVFKVQDRVSTGKVLRLRPRG